MYHRLFVVALLIGGAVSAHAQGIQVSSNIGECPTPSLGLVTEIHIAAYFRAPGVRAAEFSLSGIPLDRYLIAEIKPNPRASNATGNPFKEGCRIEFPACESGEGWGLNWVTLYTITVLDLYYPAVVPLTLEIGPHSNPSDPARTCPELVTCDESTVSPACIEGFEVQIGSEFKAPFDPTPLHQAIAVSTSTKIHWELEPFPTCDLGAWSHTVFFGTDPNPPEFVDWTQCAAFASECPPFDPGALAPNTTYYWRVVRSFNSHKATSPIWSFTTGEPTSVQKASWSLVKRLFQ